MHFEYFYLNNLEFIYQINFVTAMHWMLSPEPAQVVLTTPLIEDLINQAEFLNGPDPITWLKTQLVVTRDDILNVSNMMDLFIRQKQLISLL